MIITESQLRSIVRQVIAEEQINEGIKDSTILLTLAATVLAAAGLAGQITDSSADISLAKENIAAAENAAKKVEHVTPEISRVVEKFKVMTDPGIEMTTILSNTGGM